MRDRYCWNRMVMMMMMRTKPEMLLPFLKMSEDDEDEVDNFVFVVVE